MESPSCKVQMPEDSTFPLTSTRRATKKWQWISLLLVLILFLSIVFISIRFSESQITKPELQFFQLNLLATGWHDIKERILTGFFLVNHTGSCSQRWRGTQSLARNDPLILSSSTSSVWVRWYMILLYVVLALLVLGPGLVWFLYPRTPEVTLEKLQLDGMSTDSQLMPSKESYLPKVHVDLNLLIGLRIRNRNFIGMSYEKVTVYVNYNGSQLCTADLEGGVIRPRAVSNIEALATVKLAQILYNSPELVSDVAMQELPMNVVIEFSGYVGRKWFKAPAKIGVSLDAKLDPINTDVVEQDYQLKV